MAIATLIASRARYRIESYARKHDGVWIYQNLTSDRDLWIPCIDLTVPVQSLYENVDMSPIVPAEIESNDR